MRLSLIRLAARPSLLIGALASLLLAGCATQAELPPQVSSSLVDLRDQVIKGKAQVQTTANAARDLTTRPQASLQPQVERLLHEIDAADQTAVGARRDFASMDEHAQAYFAQWDRELKNMSEEMSARGQERREEAIASLETLKVRVSQLKAEFRPFLTDLQEAARYLRVDPTAAGVSVAKPKIDQALGREKAVLERADAVINQIDAMRGGK